MKAFDYALALTPDGYMCVQCGVSGCKLWRGDAQLLLCVDCACASQGVTATIRECGYHTDQSDTLTPEIGTYIPAVALEECPNRFWETSSTPTAAGLWWMNLPLRRIPDRLPSPTDASKKVRARNVQVELARLRAAIMRAGGKSFDFVLLPETQEALRAELGRAGWRSNRKDSDGSGQTFVISPIMN